jgi:hypothetical protein
VVKKVYKTMIFDWPKKFRSKKGRRNKKKKKKTHLMWSPTGLHIIYTCHAP